MIDTRKHILLEEAQEIRELIFMLSPSEQVLLISNKAHRLLIHLDKFLKIEGVIK